MVMHSASTVLDDIIDELRLKYDSSVGLLDGDAVREIPSLNTLQNLGKLLAKLSKSLAATEENDQKLLESVDARLAEVQTATENGENDGEVVETDDNVSENDENEGEIAADDVNLKRSRPEDDAVAADEEESMPLSKRRKLHAEETLKNAENEQIEQSEENDAANTNETSEIDGDIAAGGNSAASDANEDAPAAKKAQNERLNSKDDPMPPVQTGSFTQDNDTRLKNPKSEFVSPQTLSESAITELGLFSEENNGLETQGKDYLKRKYGVASYPENDLKRLLPGEIPDYDFSKTKAPSNQVQFSTYQSYIESYFRPFANDDIAFVNEKFVIPPGLDKNYDPLVSPYLIPKLGPFYTEVWAEEDAALGSKLSLPPYLRPPLESYKPKGDAEDILDDHLLTEDVSCGPLSSRLLSAILSVHEVKENDEENDDGENPSDTVKSESSFLGEDMFNDESASQLNAADTYKATSSDTDFHSMEERLKRELKYIGIFANTPNGDTNKAKKGTVIDSDDWIINKEDDEICAEIRQLQGELKSAVVRNRKRKKALLPVLEEHLAYQEYCTILEDLDKQVDQAYTKRLKAKSKRKKITAAETANLAQQQTANSGLKSLLEKRSRWISNIGKLFDAPEVMKRIPEESIFSNQDQSDDDDGDAEVDVVNEEAS